MGNCKNWQSFILVFVAASAGATAAHGFVAMPRIQGALIYAVEPNSPAQRIGLEAGDIIVAVNNQPLRTSLDYWRLVAAPGVTLLVRDARTGVYVTRHTMSVGGRIGVRFTMTQVPPPQGLSNLPMR